MRKEALHVVLSALLFTFAVGQVSADALIRAWVETGDDHPVELVVWGARHRMRANSVHTLSFTVFNPKARRQLQLRAVATYEAVPPEQVVVFSNTVTLEIDQTARDCRLYFYVINGYALAGSLSVSGRECRLRNDSASFVVPLGDLPSGAVVRGKVSIFAW